jgi:4-hydroxyphenylacetate 3-monooxygenase
MGARTGKEYLEGLKKPREIWIGGEKVTDVLSHPAFKRGAQSLATLYDMQHDPAIQDEMTYVEPESGERVGMSFLIPRNQEDLLRRRKMMSNWANFSGGMMGRTPDYLNSSFMAFAAAKDYFESNDPRFGENVYNYYKYIRDNDLALTHTLINPQSNRSVGVAQQADPYLPAGIVEENNEGIIIRGCRMLATLAPLADEINVFPSTVLRNQNNDDLSKYSYGFSISCTTPGLKFICRDTFDVGRSNFDHPLASRFEEMDAVVVFDDVLVPWERVFLLHDVEKCNNAYGATNAVVHMAYQVIVKNIAKAEFLLGIAELLAETIAITEFQHVQEKIAEIITYLETMKACIRASEADAKLDQYGVMTPSRPPLDTARNLFPKMYPRMVEILQLLGASGFMAIPSEADLLNSELRPFIDKYYQARNANAYDRIKLFRLAWDVACSSFGGRQVLYERFFFGDPIRMMSALYNVTDKKPYMERVKAFLDRSEVQNEEPVTVV